MNFTNGQIHEAVQALNSIAENERIIPQIAKFKLARMYDTLEPYFRPIEARRLELIQRYGSKRSNPATGQEAWGLWPDDEKFPVYLQEWKNICDEPAGEIAIKPITMTMLGTDTKGVQLQEFIWLGSLVVDTTPEE